MTKRLLTADDLYTLPLVGDLQLAPDGSFVVWQQTRIDREKQKTHNDLWLAPTDPARGEPRRFTGGEWSDTQPRISPDSRRIAFVSNRAGEKNPQLHVIAVDGGEALQLTREEGAWGGLQWAPDGKSLVATLRKKDDETKARETDEEKKKLGVVCRHIMRIHYKEDGAGWLPPLRHQIVRVDAATGDVTWLTADESRDHGSPRFSPDGRFVAYTVCVEPDADLEPDRIAIRLHELATGATRELALPVGPKGNLSFSPDGTRIAYLGDEGLRNVATHVAVWVAPLAGGPAVDLTSRHDVQAESATLNDTAGILGACAPAWSPDGRALFVHISRHGSTLLARLDPDNAARAPEVVVDGPGVVNLFSFSADRRRVALLQMTATDPGHIALREIASGTTRRLAEPAREWLDALDLTAPEEVWFDAADGHRLQGWILRPPGFNPERRYPAILQIHGGPLLQYGNAMVHEFHLLAARGYIVGFSNPRGGMGYGERHAQAICGAWGSVDYDDVMRFADVLAATPGVDTARMGVAGGSYGGYMTNWIIARSTRFAAAVTMRCVSNLVSMVGSSDFNWHFRNIFDRDGRAPWESAEALAAYWRQSPLSEIGNATTPTLVEHQEADHRCELEQGEQVYVALRRAGVPSEMVVFPDEPHGMSRNGRTDRRVARLGHILRWFDRYLQPSGA